MFRTIFLRTISKVLNKSSDPLLTNRPSLLNKSRRQNHFMSNFLRPSRYYKNFNQQSYSRRTKIGLFGGFSLSFSFMDFFKSQEELEMSVEDQVLMEIKRAILAIQEGDPAKAESHLATAWRQSVTEKLEKAQTQILDIQANLFLQKRDFERAEKCFKRVAQRLVHHQGVEPTDNAIVEISIKLAMIYDALGNKEQSIAGLQYCVGTQRSKVENNKDDEVDVDTLLLGAWSMHSLAQLFLQTATEGRINKAQLSRARTLCSEAYEYAIRASGSDSQQAIAIDCDLAAIRALDGDIETALKVLEKCEQLAKEKHEFMIPAIRVNVGSLHIQKGEYSVAELICREAKALAGKSEDHETVSRAQSCIDKSLEAIKTAKEKKKQKVEV